MTAGWFSPSITTHFGHRADDEHADEARRALGRVLPASDLLARGVAPVVADIERTVGSGYWLQVDVDVLDPAVMPAVDSPDPGGIHAEDLTLLLAALAPHASGASVAVFDPDLDPDGSFARLLTDIVVDGLAGLGSAV